MHQFVKILCLGPVLLACTQFPELDNEITAIDRDAPYPTLIPLEPALANTRAPTITPETEANLLARVDALRSRAARLRRPVIDAPTRARMKRGVRRSL